MRPAQAALATVLTEHAIREGEFTLASGRTSNWYLDGRQVTFRGDCIEIVGDAIVEARRRRSSSTRSAGSRSARCRSAWRVALVTGARSFAVRKEAKGHGVGGRMAGPVEPGDRVLVVEDTATSGGSLLDSRRRHPRVRLRDRRSIVAARPRRRDRRRARSAGRPVLPGARRPRRRLRVRFMTRDRAASAHPARHDRRRARGGRRRARPRADAPRARDVLGDVVRALLLQVVAPAPRSASRPRRRGCSSARARARASSTSATASRSRSASRATTTRPRSSRTRARPPGVGGIIRDIFSMGARPIALMDPLRFGPLDDPRTRYLFEGVVSGISGYGNAVGVPTVGGEVVFDECYRGNPLVNVLCLGMLPNERLVLARAEGVGNLAVLLGSSTGRDGIGGASVLASAGFVEGSARPSARRCRSATRSRRRSSSRRASSCSTRGSRSACRTSARRGCRARRPRPRRRPARAWTSTSARVPKREPGMNPVEMLTSESQERMLAIVTPGEPRRGARALRALGDPRHGRRPGHRHRRGSASTTGYFDAVGVPGANPPPPIGDDAARGVLGPRRRSPTSRSAASATARCTTARSRRPPTSTSARPRIPRRSCCTRFPPGSDLVGRAARPARRRRTSPTRAGCGASTTTSCSSTPSPARAATPACCGSRRPTAEGARALGRRQGPVLRARPAHRRPARGARGGAQRRVHRRARRWRWSTASTSATPSTPR